MIKKPAGSTGAGNVEIKIIKRGGGKLTTGVQKEEEDDDVKYFV